ncbi:hypothetical protein CEXT_293131 [Caerostris extrusa]|uniref:Uncharacterized protein n=1 Tax=Caerostris extrusa TaxID=172846 RepID=A0AAV4T2L6_CAEEX|nr:hypothetical protein CEXT_293131 [Caerostris extrusa]
MRENNHYKERKHRGKQKKNPFSDGNNIPSEKNLKMHSLPPALTFAGTFQNRRKTSQQSRRKRIQTVNNSLVNVHEQLKISSSGIVIVCGGMLGPKRSRGKSVRKGHAEYSRENRIPFFPLTTRMSFSRMNFFIGNFHALGLIASLFLVVMSGINWNVSKQCGKLLNNLVGRECRLNNSLVNVHEQLKISSSGIVIVCAGVLGSKVPWLECEKRPQ